MVLALELVALLTPTCLMASKPKPAQKKCDFLESWCGFKVYSMFVCLIIIIDNLILCISISSANDRKYIHSKAHDMSNDYTSNWKRNLAWVFNIKHFSDSHCNALKHDIAISIYYASKTHKFLSNRNNCNLE